MPSTLVPFIVKSAASSRARNTIAVSVEKLGLPVPPAKITTRPFSRCLTARLRINSSANDLISVAVITLNLFEFRLPELSSRHRPQLLFRQYPRSKQFHWL